MREEKKIGIIGPGRMGVGIATAVLSSDHGHSITMIDLKERAPGEEYEALNRAKEAITNNLTLLQNLEEFSTPLSKIDKYLKLSNKIESEIVNCDIIFEALPEKPEIKKKFINKIEPILNEAAIIASATSTINLETFWEVSQRPERIITAHWLNPAFIIPLVELSVGEKTSERTVEEMKAFLIELGKIPVILKDNPGFIVPRIQTAAMNEAVRIVEEGVATAEDVDTAIKAGFGFRLAVLGLMEFIDLGGVDILFHAGNFLNEKLSGNHYKPPKSILDKVRNGEVGPKTGKGFFDYSNIDIESMFNDRYKGFFELLNLVKHSQVLNFEGGIRKS